MRLSTTRRQFLRTATVTTLVASAGCTNQLALDSTRELTTYPDTLFRDGLRRLGNQADRTIPESVHFDWRVPDINTGDHTAAKSSPVLAPTGDIIIPGDTGVVTAVSPSGDVRWEARTEPSKRGIHGTPVIANGEVYIGAYDGALYSFDLDTGERLWRTKLGDAIGSSPIYHAGMIYIPVEFFTPSGSIFGVDAATGSIEWEDDRPTDHPHSTPAIDPEYGKLVFGSNDGTLYAWDYPSLEFAWGFETGGPIKGPIGTYDGAAYFGSWDHSVYRVDLNTGQEDWAFEADDKVMTAPGIDPDRGVVYMGSHDQNVYALGAETGSLDWKYSTNGLVLGSVTVTADHVLVGSYDRHLYAINRWNGTRKWRIEGVGWVTSAPLVTENAVYFADRKGPTRSGGVYRVVSSL